MSSSSSHKDSLNTNIESALQLGPLALLGVVNFFTEPRSFQSEIQEGCLAYASEERPGACNCFV